MEGSPRLVQRPARSLPSSVTVNSRSEVSYSRTVTHDHATAGCVSMACDGTREVPSCHEDEGSKGLSGVRKKGMRDGIAQKGRDGLTAIPLSDTSVKLRDPKLHGGAWMPCASSAKLRRRNI